MIGHWNLVIIYKTPEVRSDKRKRREKRTKKKEKNIRKRRKREEREGREESQGLASSGTTWRALGWDMMSVSG